MSQVHKEPQHRPPSLLFTSFPINFSYFDAVWHSQLRKRSRREWKAWKGEMKQLEKDLSIDGRIILEWILKKSGETGMFLTMFTRARHWSLFWARWLQSTPSHTISLRSILILSSHLRLGLPSGLVPSCFPTKISRAFLTSPMRATCPARSHPPLSDHPNYIWWSAQVMKFLIMQSSPASRHFLSLRSKYSLQHPVLRHPQYMFLL
jgi:hypothetical protein